MQDYLMELAGVYVQEPPPDTIIASRVDRGKWKWSTSFANAVRDVYVAPPPTTAPYEFGTDYQGVITGKRGVTLSFSKPGIYLVKVVLSDSGINDELYQVAAGNYTKVSSR
jgi:hypothetical protein